VRRREPESGSKLAHRMLRRLIGLFVCQHRRLVYPPRPDYDICYDCGKKRLRDKTGQGIGKFSYNVDDLLRSPQVDERSKSRWFRRTDARVILVFAMVNSAELGIMRLAAKRFSYSLSAAPSLCQ